MGPPGVVRLAVNHSVLPALMSEASEEGASQVLGSSAAKLEPLNKPVPSGATKLKSKTRKPLVTPSVPLKRKLIVFVPATTVPAGRFIVNFNVENPPPIPP